MVIAEIRGYLVRCALPEAQGNAAVFYDQRSALIVQVIDADGRSGWGEAWHSPEAAGEIIRNDLASAVLGQSPADYARLWDDMVGRLGYDRHGTGLMAVSGLDMAIWDLRAWQLDVSIATLLGGARRQRAFAYAAGPYFRPNGDPYRSYADEVAEYTRRGFRAIKMKCGLNPARDAEIIQKVREIIGDDVALMIDINQGYSAASSIALAARVTDCNLVWIEEPVLPTDLSGYGRIARSTRTPIAGGEALGGSRAFADFIQLGEPEIVQPDLSVCGGYTEAVRISAVADVFGRTIVPHVGVPALTRLRRSSGWALSLTAAVRPPAHSHGSSSISPPILSAILCPCRGRTPTE